MRAAAVPDGESVWRSAVFPVAFKKNKLSPKTFFKLWPADEGPFVLEMSLVRGKYAPTLSMVHGFGCRLAASQNRNLVDRGKNADKVYCGAYQLKASDICELRGTPKLSEVTKAEVLNIVEDGEFAHSNARIEVDTKGDEDAVEPIKTLIVDRLWHQSAGPSKHVCKCDEEANPHPSAWLQDGPKGPYVDTRSKIRVAIEIMVYFLFHHPRLWINQNVQAAADWLKSFV
jgi:hypothetical protein